MTHKSNSACVFWPLDWIAYYRNRTEALRLPPPPPPCLPPPPPTSLYVSVKFAKLASASAASLLWLCLPSRCISQGVSGKGLLFQTHTIACCTRFPPALAQGMETTSYFHLYQLHTRDLNSSLSLDSLFFNYFFLPDNLVNAK